MFAEEAILLQGVWINSSNSIHDLLIKIVLVSD